MSDRVSWSLTFYQLLPATIFQAEVLDNRIRPGSHPDDKGHNAIKAPFQNSFRHSVRGEQSQKHALQTAQGQSAPSIVVSINDETKNFEESQQQYKLVTYYNVLPETSFYFVILLVYPRRRNKA